MRYTRYNYQKKKGNNILKFVGIVALFLVMAIAIGKGLSDFLVKDMDKAPNGTGVEAADTNQLSSGSSVTFYVYQGGYYGKEENALGARDQLKASYSSFMVKDGDKFRVIIDMEKKSEEAALLQRLEAAGISFVKKEITISYDSLSQEILGQSMDALMQYYDKLKEGEVAGIKTQDLKAWSNSLQEIGADDPHRDKVTRIKEYIATMPEELTKDNLESIGIFIYEVIAEFTA